MAQNDKAPTVEIETTPGDSPPARQISPEALGMLGSKLKSGFERYQKDRAQAEQRWLKNLRQFVGQYDADIEKQIGSQRSKAYPRITRVKALTVLARIMNLMFPGNEKNWEVTATPSADIEPDEVMQEIEDMLGADEEAGAEPQPVTRETVRRAVQRVAERHARELEVEIEDQLQEIGGDQTLDYIALVRSVCRSGILYGPGYLAGPYAKSQEIVTWDIGDDGKPTIEQQTVFRPVFEFVPVWDYYPDMAAKRFQDQDGYYIRKVLTRSEFRKLADREDMFSEQIKYCIKRWSDGNYKPQGFETELRSMGLSEAISNDTTTANKYEVIIYHGNISGTELKQAGVDVSDDMLVDDIEAEIWMVSGKIIKADINAWRKLGKSVRMIHAFVFDEDDTSLVGTGLPEIVRDSQMSICAATRMLLDNASVVCGPSLEMNTDLLRADQDISSIGAYKIWYREGAGPDAQFPAVRDIPVNSHMQELLNTIDLFMRFADQETFVGPATGGEPQRGSAEPMRTAAGASMLRADASLPFKDVVRNFDTFTQSVIQSLVTFNDVFNPRVPKGDYNVVARGATSLIAKEVRGAQMDQLATTISPEERIHVDDRKFVEQRFAVRDLQGLLVSPDEADRRRKASDQRAAQQEKTMQDMAQAEMRKVLSAAYKDVTQAQKNEAATNAAQVNSALDVLERGISDENPEAAGAGAE